MPSFARSAAHAAVGSAGPMSSRCRRAIVSLSLTAFLCGGCAPSAVMPPAREPPAHLLLAEATIAPSPGAPSPGAPSPGAPSPAAPSPPPSNGPAPAADPGSPPAPLPAAEAQHAPNDARASKAMPRALGWYSIGLGAGAAIVAIGTSIMMLHQANVRDNDCNAAKVCSADGITAAQQLDALAGWNVGAYIVAAVGIGLGTILVLTNPTDGRQTALSVSPNGSGAGLTLRSTF